MASGRSAANLLARAVAVFLTVGIGVLSALPASAHQTVFGPQKFVRSEGKPVTETVTFTVPAYANAPSFILRVQNGDSKETRVASAEIELNDVEVVDEHEFKKGVALIEKPVVLQASNVLSVKIKSGHGKEHGEGEEGKWKHHDNDVGAALSGRPFLILTIFAHWADTTPPAVSFASPGEGARINDPQPAIKASWSDDLSGVDPASAVFTIDGQEQCRGEACLAQSGFQYVPTNPLPDGAHVLRLTVRDFEGNEGPAVRTFTVDTTPPAVPSGLSATAGDGQVSLSWSASADPDFAGYNVYRATTPGGPYALVGARRTSPEYLDTGLTNGATYYYAVTSLDTAGNESAKSAEVRAAPVAPPPPGGGLPPDPASVAPPLDRTVATPLHTATAFLYTGANPIQTGVAPGTIEPRRAAVLRGKVLQRDGTPLSGVKVTILGRPEYGSTLTRADGMFDMAVNGGGLLTVDYQKEGFLPAQRQVHAPWEDFAFLSDVVMIQPDQSVTAVDLTSPAPIQVARGSVVTDGDGTRQATLLFPAGTTAHMILPNGTSQPISTLSVRATEYTVGQTGPRAMPAELPPTSGYTYAVEFSVDEAVSAGASVVGFSRPVISYVENFLNFPTGTPVPVGYYDREKGVWIPSQNGIVLTILSVTNGLADIDTTGTGQPADAAALSSLGITDAERAQLALLYPQGQSLWRFAVAHFSPWDCNWPWGPPNDATAPNQPDPLSNQVNDPDCAGGSMIECQNQALGESVKIAGTPFSLHYKSDRVAGRKAAYSLDISLSGQTVPASLKRIELGVDVAGRRWVQSAPAAPNQVRTFAWDGMDSYGRPTQGRQSISIRIGYVYDAVYQKPAQVAKSFALFSGVPISGIRGRREFTIWQEWRTGSRVALTGGLGGWSMNAHHSYDPFGRTIFLGNGGQQGARGIDNVITTVAGGGSPLDGFGDGGPAKEARLSYPMGITIGPDGSLFISDVNNDRIRRVRPDGVITTVAGGGSVLGDGGPATEAALWGPTGVANGPDGSLYIADSRNHRIRRVNPDGIISTVAGTGVQGFGGDEGPATLAQLNSPAAVAVGPDNSLYIVDYLNWRIRRVGPDGIIATVAGGGGGTGDGGPATQTKVWATDVTVASDGSLYIADNGSHTVRQVGLDGIIRRVAGTGSLYFMGDGGLATYAGTLPNAVALSPENGLIIADDHNRIRRVASDGIITTVAGTGTLGFGGDGGPAMQAAMMLPRGVASGPDGSLYLSDFWNDRIRKISSPLPGFSTTDILIASSDGRELYVFDGVGRHLRTVDTLTGATLYSFAHANGLIVSVTDRDGNVTTIERDGSGNPTAIVGPYGQRTTLALDANGYLASVTNPANETHQFAYTPDGLMTAMTNPRGNAWSFTYDSLGRLTRDANPAGGSWDLSRSETTNSFEVSMTSALGRMTRYLVERLTAGDERRVNTNPDGTQTEEFIRPNGTRTFTGPDGTVTNRTEGPDPRFGMQAPITSSLSLKTPSGLTYQTGQTRTATLTDPNNPLSLSLLADTFTVNGRAYLSTYDAATRTTTSSTPAGRTSTSTIDAKGRVIQSKWANLEPTDFAWDSRGRLASLTQGASSPRTYSLAYNPEGYLSGITDPLGRSVGFGYDLAGRITSQTLPDGRVVSWQYDPNGNVTTITPPSRPAHAFSYTPVDLESEYLPPDVGFPPATRYSYNLNKQLSRITRPDGQVVDLIYDSGGRLSSITLPTGNFSYAYNPATGNLETITAGGGGTVNYTWDGFLLTGTTWIGAVTGSVTRIYDSDFRTSSITVNGETIGLAYDPDSLLTQAGSLTLTRDSQSGLVTGTSLGSVTTTQAYNGFGEIIDQRASASGSEDYAVQHTRDALGRVTGKTETVQGVTATYSYGYDPAGRLTEVKKDGAVISQYQYDSNSNRVGALLAAPVSATYDAQDRLLSYGANTYVHTQNGELSGKTNATGTTAYQYDVLGSLKSVLLPDGTFIEYLIDGRNRRIGKKVNGVLTQGFLWQDQLKPIAELDGAGNVTARFVYGTKPNVPEYMVRGGTAYRIVTDHLGSPRLIVEESTGNIVQRLDYDEFGNVFQDTNPGFQPFGFAGGIYDPQTKLVRFGARDYDPEVGRWTAKDPIRFAGGDVNLYGYVLNDPVNWVDPNGLRYWPPGFGGGDVTNWSPIPIPAVGDRGPFSPDCCMNIPPRGKVLPGESPPFADVDFIKIGNEWYKIRGPIIILPDGTIIGDWEKASEEEVKRLEGKKCK